MRDEITGFYIIFMAEWLRLSGQLTVTLPAYETHDDMMTSSPTLPMETIIRSPDDTDMWWGDTDLMIPA